MRPDKNLVPPHFRESLDAWVADARPTGDFLCAVLENNLKEAIGRADENALAALPHIVAFLYNDAPSSSWGSPANVAEWGGLVRASVGQTIGEALRPRRQ